MKKQIYIFSIAALLVVSLIMGCKKETESDAVIDNGAQKSLKATMSDELEELYNQLSQPKFGNIKLINGDILRFESVEHYEQVYESLNDLYEAWTTLFISKYDTKDEDELDEIIEKLNFDDNFPLLKFVEEYKVKQPLINEIVLKEEKWLEEGGSTQYPADPITNCLIEQTLLSRYYEYCIEDTICQLRPNGCQILIPTSQLSSLSYIRNVSIKELLSLDKDPPYGEDKSKWAIYIPSLKVTVYIPKSGGCNKTNFDKGGTKYNTSDYKFEWMYNCRYTGGFSDDHIKTTATVKNYKWKSKKGRWDKDYGSRNQIEFKTQLYEYYFENDICKKGTTLSKTSFNTKTFSKSKNDRKKVSIFKRDPNHPFTSNCVGYLTQKPDESSLNILHRDKAFPIDLITGQ